MNLGETDMFGGESEFPMLHCQCKKGHEWKCPIPSYWTTTKSCCPECGADMVSFCSGGTVSLEELQAGIKASLDKKS